MSSTGTPPRPVSDPNHERRLRVAGQLAGGIAHDFNNLLTAILGAAAAILDRVDTTAETAEDARQIRRGVERGAALVRQLLAFSRQQALQPQIIMVNAAIEDTARLLRRLLGEKVTVAMSLEQPGRRVKVDSGQLDQVLLNLAVNARDAMAEGGTLTLSSGHATVYRPRLIGRETMPPGRYATITVTDTGDGIPDHVMPRIFEPFFTTKPAQGSASIGTSLTGANVTGANLASANLGGVGWACPRCWASSANPAVSLMCRAGSASEPRRRVSTAT
jgi:two-component system cell cycle sensor histidine kinase/response regulator CckA